MQLSKNILRGVLLGVSAISLAGIPSDAAAQKSKKIPAKMQQPEDTARQANCIKFDPKLSPQYRPYVAQDSRVSAAADSTKLIDKHPCITCGRG